MSLCGVCITIVLHVFVYLVFLFLVMCLVREANPSFNRVRRGPRTMYSYRRERTGNFCRVSVRFPRVGL
jgi:hypothetical protein